ncbi:MAG: MFS transporter, partial [Deltaproteobacteria bacterium]|nr:MFS transporter [Deltaproteobacteria bacterium]
MESPTDEKPLYSKFYVNYVIVLLAFVNLFNFVNRMVITVALQPIKIELGLSDAQLGLLTGFAFALFYAICGIPIARWADKGVRKNIISLAILIWSIMTAMTGMAQNFLHLFLSRTGLGIGEACCTPPSHSMISDYVPVARRSSALAIHTAGSTLGIMVALVLGGWLCSHF